MRRAEGRGYLLLSGGDVPYAGWGGVRALDRCLSFATAPWESLAVLVGLATSMPGGFDLLWDAPVAWMTQLPPEVRAGLWKVLTSTPGLTLHARDAAFASLLRAPAHLAHHGPAVPSGDLGHAWRQGWLGWVPEPAAAPSWILPGKGEAEAQEAPGWLWGEAILPLGALEHLDPGDLARAMEDAQAHSELAIAHRLDAGAWPKEAVPFHRRRAGWRLAFLGGREWQLGGGTWERAAERIRELAERLGASLRCPIHAGVSSDFQAASDLGRQAMNEGLPWRAPLPLPPALPTFTPGLGSDPRDPVTLEARCAFPAPLAAVLAPPSVLLRVPAVPAEGAVATFAGGFTRPPALRWLPPEAELPGPFLPERPWAPADRYPAVADTTQGRQRALFEDEDAPLP